jgi:uncharacterized protein YgiM (DUF1202 family)
LLAAVGAFGLASTSRGDEFPYGATVNSPDVFVRSGPGKNYYPTDKLSEGERVEVYRLDPGGWCAIRPPKKSFSWVAARQLDPISDDLALVNGDRVVARVGSTLSSVRDVIQVRLDRGEKVEILESAKATGGHWCKIAPPSGEFRWVYSKFLDRDSAPSGSLAQHAPDGTAADRDADGSKSAIRLTAGASADIAAAPEAPRGASGGTAPLETMPLEKMPHETPPADHPPLDRPRQVPVRPYGSPAAFQRELNDVDLEISAMLVKDPSGWSWDELHSRAEGDFAAARTAPERGRARALVNKIVRLEEIKQRQGQITIVPSESLRPSRGPVDGQTLNTVPQMGGFDGIGRLEPVMSRRVGAPQYALLDAKGGIACFVTPAPGVNLQSYVNKQVGVNGSRSYVTDLQKQHIDVQRITLLDVTRR